MNKQEIEKAIEYFRAGNFLGKSMDKHINVAISALEHQLTNGWIPASQPPENNRHKSGEPIEFNIILLGGIVATTGCINNEGIWGWMDWEDYRFIPIGGEVLYWRPLPEPPKGVSHD